MRVLPDTQILGPPLYISKTKLGEGQTTTVNAGSEERQRLVKFAGGSGYLESQGVQIGAPFSLLGVRKAERLFNHSPEKKHIKLS